MRCMKTPSSMVIDVEANTSLLGGLSPQRFMKKHWQKKPLLIRQALPGVQAPISRAELFALAGLEGVESRLIEQQPRKKGRASWSLKHGPFARRALPPLSQPAWTLLVQGLDLHVSAARELLDRFRFVPEARLDDLMISFATDGGGVGPHFDSYDVFLLQVQGRRRWRIGRLEDPSLQPDVPLKILSNFEVEEEWVLEPGDMLYLPPRWAHDGVAEGGECMTCSIGFRAPMQAELARELLVRCADGVDTDRVAATLYRDAKQEATGTPGHIPVALVQFATQAVQAALESPQALRVALGEYLTEPKAQIWFDLREPLHDGRGVQLDARTRMMYDSDHVYVNGESWRAAGRDARLMQRLADERRLTAREVSSASEGARELLSQWCEDGWLQPEEHDDE